MAKLNLSTAFARYGAKLTNPQWAVSAISDQNELVMSCWKDYLTLTDGVLRYVDTLSRWEHNKPGNNLLREHLERAISEGLAVRLVIANATDMFEVNSGKSAAGIANSFSVKVEVVGSVTSFDGDEFIIEFVASDS
jgi:hypothetical protein